MTFDHFEVYGWIDVLNCRIMVRNFEDDTVGLTETNKMNHV